MAFAAQKELDLTILPEFSQAVRNLTLYVLKLLHFIMFLYLKNVSFISFLITAFIYSERNHLINFNFDMLINIVTRL